MCFSWVGKMMQTSVIVLLFFFFLSFKAEHLAEAARLIKVLMSVTNPGK